VNAAARIVILAALLAVAHLLAPVWLWTAALPLVWGATLTRSTWEAFSCGLGAGALAWGGGAAVFLAIDARVALERIAQALRVGEPWKLLVATAATGAAIAAMSALTGRLLREAISGGTPASSPPPAPSEPRRSPRS
jgi:hypothetical protein